MKLHESCYRIKALILFTSMIPVTPRGPNTGQVALTTARVAVIRAPGKISKIFFVRKNQFTCNSRSRLFTNLNPSRIHARAVKAVTSDNLSTWITIEASLDGKISSWKPKNTNSPVAAKMFIGGRHFPVCDDREHYVTAQCLRLLHIPQAFSVGGWPLFGPGRY